MLFAVVSGVGQGMGVLDGNGDHRRGRGSFGGEFALWHSSVKLHESIENLRCHFDGEWGLSRDGCVRWGPHLPRGGEVSGIFLSH